MIAGIVPTRDVLSLRVAMVVQGVDIEFGATSNRLPFQRFDILEADETRARAILANFPRVRTGRPVKRYQEPAKGLVGRPKVHNRRDTTAD
jgi:hypothetical protein